MAESTGTTPAPAPSLDVCARCSTPLDAGSRVLAAGRAFCRTCYSALRAELAEGIAAMSRDINWPMAVLGAVLGGTAGALAWWGFTAVTHFSLGLVAIAIGVLTAMGAVRFSGNKRSRGIQVMAIVVSVLAYVVASYLVNMSNLNHFMAQQGDPRRIGFPPASFGQFARVVGLGFGIMDVVFLAIVIYEAWRVAKPMRMPGAQAT